MPHTPPLQHLTLSTLQWDIQFGNPEANRARSFELIAEAANQGAQLVVLPELCISGYAFDDKEEALSLGEPPEGPTEQAWLDCAKRHNCAIAAGIAERRDQELYNALVFITPEGIRGRYHKVHLFDREKLFFTPGKSIALVSWQGIKLGLMLCYDGWFPEFPRTLALAGAELLLAPGCWIQRPALYQDLQAGVALHLAAAYSSSLFIACASRTGLERELQFAGNSAILGPNGLVAGPASAHEDSILTAQIDLREARFKHRTKRTHPIKDRRPELYNTQT